MIQENIIQSTLLLDLRKADVTGDYLTCVCMKTREGRILITYIDRAESKVKVNILIIHVSIMLFFELIQ